MRWFSIYKAFACLFITDPLISAEVAVEAEDETGGHYHPIVKKVLDMAVELVGAIEKETGWNSPWRTNEDLTGDYPGYCTVQFNPVITHQVRRDFSPQGTAPHQAVRCVCRETRKRF